MSNKIKVCVVITARPSYSRFRTAMVALGQNEGIELVVICSGSALLDRYGSIVDSIRGDGFQVVDELYTFVEGNELINMSLSTANTITSTSYALRKIQPDFVISIADRYETLGTAIAASYMSIPLIHVQGGEITGNIDEKVRHAVSKLSDIHLVASESCANRLIRMGENPSVVFNTGCPSIDIARESSGISMDDVNEALLNSSVGGQVDLTKDFGVVLQHPETENFELGYQQMMITLNVVSAKNIPVLVFWPNVDAGSDFTAKAIRVFREKYDTSKMAFIKNIPGLLFLKLLSKSRFLIGNSSVGIRESAYLGVPVINIGDRQKGRDRSHNVVDVMWDKNAIEQALELQLAEKIYNSSDIYGDGFSGAEIAKVICGLQKPEMKRFYEG